MKFTKEQQQYYEQKGAQARVRLINWIKRLFRMKG